MTLAAAKELIFKLPRRQRLRLAAELSSPDPILPGSVGIEELERRIDEVESGKVKTVPADKVLADLKKLIRSKAHKRPRQRGRRPGPATSNT